MKIDNPELVRLLGESKVNLCEMVVAILEDIDGIRQRPKSAWDDEQVRQLNGLKGIFTMVTGFIARTPELAEGDDMEVTGARESKANRKSVPSGYTKLPRPADA